MGRRLELHDNIDHRLVVGLCRLHLGVEVHALACQVYGRWLVEAIYR